MESQEIHNLTLEQFCDIPELERSLMHLSFKSCAGIETLKDLKHRITNLVCLNAFEGYGTKLQTLNVLFRRGATKCDTTVTAVVHDLVREQTLVIFPEKTTVLTTPRYVSDRDIDAVTAGLTENDKHVGHANWLRAAR
jgi:hypothetical protein